MKLSKDKSGRLILDCSRCGGKHKLDIKYTDLSKEQQAGQEPILDNFVCDRIALMYKVTSFALDSRVGLLKEEKNSSLYNQGVAFFREEWGDSNLEIKLERVKKLDLTLLGIPDEYYGLVIQIINSYCCGQFFPAMTASGVLGERIFNRLIIKTRNYFKDSKRYNKIWRKDSFESWDCPIKILIEWKVITEEVGSLFLKLKKFRNDSIHYNDAYDFKENSHKAVKTLTDIIDKLFNYINRTDLFWVLNSPGEIFVRSEVVSLPFVQEFVLPHCVQIAAYDEPSTTLPFKACNVPLKPLTDEAFLELRKNRNK